MEKKPAEKGKVKNHFSTRNQTSTRTALPKIIQIPLYDAGLDLFAKLPEKQTPELMHRNFRQSSGFTVIVEYETTTHCS